MNTLISINELQSLIVKGKQKEEKQQKDKISKVKEYIQREEVIKRFNKLCKEKAEEGCNFFQTHTSFFYSSEIYKSTNYGIMYMAAKEFLEANGFVVKQREYSKGFEYMIISWEKN